MRAAHYRCRDGFTLIEMLVVVGVIMLMTAMSVAAFAPFMKGRQLSAGARTVQAAVYQARAYAAANRVRTVLYFATPPLIATMQEDHNIEPWSINLYSLGVDTNGNAVVSDEKIARPEFLPRGVTFLGTPIPTDTIYFPDQSTPADVPPDDMLFDSIAGVGNALVFHPGGSLDPVYMGTVTQHIVLQDPSEQRKRISVMFASGMVYIEDL